MHCLKNLINRKTSNLFFVFAIGLVLSIITKTQNTHANSVVKADGSSTVYPITEAVAEEFQLKDKGKNKVTVGISGTGGGFKKFCRGETDIQNASRPISTSEMETCKTAGIKYFELPIGFDAITIVVNPKAEWIKEISVQQLKKMWEPASQGKITKWNQIDPSWPDAPLKLFGAGADSGTFDYFTEAIVGKAKSSRSDFTPSEDDNVIVQAVANDKYALGYFGLSYYTENAGKLKALPITSLNSKSAVLPSAKTVEDGTYTPLSRPIFIYVNENSRKRAEVKEFVDFYLKNAPRLVSATKYVPLPQKAYDIGLEHLIKSKTGTVFDGKSEVGTRIEEILKKEAKL